MLFDASSFLRPLPRFGSSFNLLSLMNKFYNVSIIDRSGHISIIFYAKFNSTKVRFKDNYLGNSLKQFLFKSIILICSKFKILMLKELTLLFFILTSWISGKLTISEGIAMISLFDTSIFVIGRHYHQFWSSKFISSMWNNYRGISFTYCPI